MNKNGNLKITVAEQIIPKWHHLFDSKVWTKINRRFYCGHFNCLKEYKTKNQRTIELLSPLSKKDIELPLIIITQHVPYLTEIQCISWPVTYKTSHN